MKYVHPYSFVCNEAAPRRASMQVLSANAGKARTATMGGREYFVAPMTLIVNGVLSGSKGDLFYPSDEIERTTTHWNMMPIVVYHPVVNGVHVSARDPEILNKQWIGHVLNSRYSDGKLRAEGWFDKERTRAVDPRVYARLEMGQRMELSTGLFTDNAPEQGVFNGRSYSHVARNYRPDHLAILPDMVGACNNNDGCGVLIGNETVGNYDPDQLRDADGRWTEAGRNPSGHGGAAWRGNRYGQDARYADRDTFGGSQYRARGEEREASVGALAPTEEAADATLQWLDNFDGSVLNPERGSVRYRTQEAEKQAKKAAELSHSGSNERASSYHAMAAHSHELVATMLEYEFLGRQLPSTRTGQIEGLIRRHREAYALHSDASKMLVGNYDPDQKRDSHGRWTNATQRSVREPIRGRPQGSLLQSQTEAAEAAEQLTFEVSEGASRLRNDFQNQLPPWLYQQLDRWRSAVDFFSRHYSDSEALSHLSKSARSLADDLDSAIEQLSYRQLDDDTRAMREEMRELRDLVREAEYVNHDAAEEFTVNRRYEPCVLDDYLLTNAELGEFACFRNDHERAAAFQSLIQPLADLPVSNCESRDEVFDFQQLLTVNLFDVQIGGQRNTGHWFSTCARDEHGWCTGKGGGGRGAKLEGGDDTPPPKGGEAPSQRKRGMYASDIGGMYDDVVRPIIDTATGGVGGRVLGSFSKKFRTDYDNTLFAETGEALKRIAKMMAVGTGAVGGAIVGGLPGAALGAAAGTAAVVAAPKAMELAGRAASAAADAAWSGTKLAAKGAWGLMSHKQTRVGGAVVPASIPPTAKVVEPKTAIAVPEAKEPQLKGGPPGGIPSPGPQERGDPNSPAEPKERPPSKFEVKTATAAAARSARNAKKAAKPRRAKAHEAAAKKMEEAAEVYERAGSAKEVEKYKKLAEEHRAASLLTYNQLAVEEFRDSVTELLQLLTTNAEERAGFFAGVAELPGVEEVDKTAVINWLVANCDCWKEPQDREVLTNFSEQKLNKMKAAAEYSKAQEAVVSAVQKKHAKTFGATLTVNEMPGYVESGTRCGGGGQKPPMEEEEEEEEEEKEPTGNKRLTTEQYLATLPREVQETVKLGLQSAAREKQSIVNRITANARGTPDQILALRESLSRKGIPELNQLALIAAPVSNDVSIDYSLNVPSDFTVNDADDFLALPSMLKE